MGTNSTFMPGLAASKVFAVSFMWASICVNVPNFWYATLMVSESPLPAPPEQPEASRAVATAAAGDGQCALAPPDRGERA